MTSALSDLAAGSLLVISLVGCGPPPLSDDSGAGDTGMLDTGTRDAPWIHERDGGRRFPQSDSWNVVATLRPSASATFPDGSPEQAHAFTLRLDSSYPDMARATAGAFGDQIEFAFHGTSDHELALDAPVTIAMAPGAACGGYGPVAYATLDLVFDDTNGDNWDDRVTGTATGTVRFASGDTLREIGITATISAVPDDVAPTLEVVGTSSGRNPVDGAYVRIGEPIANGIVVRLVAPDGTEVPMFRPDGHDASFVTEAPAVLAFDTNYSIVVAPGFGDLGGNTAPSPAGSITTAADPGLQPEDGFDAGLHALVGGGAELVDDSAGAHVISGSSSLVLAPGFAGLGRATMRFAVSAGDTMLHFQYALLALDSDGGTFIGAVRGLADGSAPTELEIASPTPGVWEDSGVPSAPLRGPEQAAAIALPAAAVTNGEVILDVDLRPTSCGGLYPHLLGIMIDDVRVE